MNLEENAAHAGIGRHPGDQKLKKRYCAYCDQNYDPTEWRRVHPMPSGTAERFLGVLQGEKQLASSSKGRRSAYPLPSTT